MVRGRGTKGDRIQISNIEIVGLGALNIDHLYRVERILEDGEAVVLETKSSPGGSAANTIYGLAKLGVSTGFAGVVGDDAEGKLLVEDFQKVGVDTSQIRVKSGAKTGSVLCLSDRPGRRALYVIPGANSLLTTNDLDFIYVNQAGMLHLSSFADDRQFEVLLELMGRLDPAVKLSFSPGALYAAKGLKALSPILARTYVLFIDLEEVEKLTGNTFLGSESCIALLSLGCQIVAVTLGKGKAISIGKRANGKKISAVCYIKDAENEYVVDVSRHSLPEVDTTGAGDAFATGFLYGLLTGKGLEECGRLGNIVAQFSISQIGAREGLPTLTKLSRRYQELYGKKL